LAVSQRDVFVPDDGCVFFKADYEALELRLIAYNSGSRLLLEWLEAGDAADPHIENARILWPAAGIPAGMTKKSPNYKTWRSPDGLSIDFYREMAKPCAYALTYQAPSRGRRGDKYPQLYSQLKKFMPDMEESYVNVLADRYFGAHTEIRAMQHEFMRQVTDEGRIVLPQTGDLLWLPPTARGFNQAINYRHQSAGGALINKALIEIRRQTGPLRRNSSGVMLQVHDELAGQIREDEVEKFSKIVETAMGAPANFGGYTAGIPAKVPSGPNWKDCE